MKDFFKNDIKENDYVIYIKGLRTGSSSSRKIMFAGKVIKVKEKKVEIERKYNNEHCKNNVIDTIFPKDIIVMNKHIDDKLFED